MMTIDDVAALVDPVKAQYAVARVCAVLGRKFDWNSDTFDELLIAVAPAAPSGCPAFFDQDENAEAFWQNLIG